MTSKITIIIPIYNAEQYLKECIDSILYQDYNNIELLLVEDSSTDQSEAICREYASLYEDIQLIKQPNSGVAAARNNGLRQATGEYIVFVDADDYLPEPNVLSQMMTKIQENNADIVVGDYMRLWNGKLLPATSTSSFNRIPTGDGAFRFAGFFSAGTLSYVWGKIYRAAFLKENEIVFEQFNYAEDKLFNFTCYIKNAKYTFSEHPAYVYRKNDDSASYRYREDSVKNWMEIAAATQHMLQIQNKSCDDLVAYTIFFAGFFDGKMNYEHAGKRMATVRNILKEYGEYPLSKKYYKKLSKRKERKAVPSLMWRTMLWGFAFAMRLHLYGFLAFGIKLFVDLKIDERLADTGKRE